MHDIPEIIPFSHTEEIREKIREYTRAEREERRNGEADSMRLGLGEIQSKLAELDNLTEADVERLANKIKRSKHASIDDMYGLSCAFLQGIENIRAFSKIQGAIQIVVKELTGKDAEKQIRACETLCNLSLGERPVCEKIATLAGSYLITYLNSKEERLKRTSLWTLANIMATGGKGAIAMISMEIVPKLLVLYLSTEELEEDYREDAAIVLDVITSAKRKLLRPIDRQALFEVFHTKNPTSPGAEYHLKIIFHSQVMTPTVHLTEEQVTYLINFCLSNLAKTVDFQSITNVMKILYSIRILANLLALDAKSFNVVIEKCSVWDTNIVQILNKVFGFKNQPLSAEGLWLLKNIVLCQSESFPASDFLQNLKIPCESLPPQQVGA